MQLYHNGANRFSVTADGSAMVLSASNITVSSNLVGYDNEVFSLLGRTDIPHYGIRWNTLSYSGANLAMMLGGFGGVSIFSGGAEGIRLDVNGNVSMYHTLTAPTIEASSSITVANGASFYARRATGSAQVAVFRYDSGTDDLSTLMGGTIWRVRDTGAGVLMSLTNAGYLTTLAAVNGGAGFDINGSAFAKHLTSYHVLYDPSGAIALYLGGTADPTNYYENTSHQFTPRSGGTIWAKVDSGGFTINSNLYFTSNYGQGHVGVYDPAKYRAVFAMGDAYKMANDGSTLGSLYGLFYGYDQLSGYVNVTGHALGHGLGIAEAGAPKAYIGSLGFWHAGALFMVGGGAFGADVTVTTGNVTLASTGKSFVNGRGHKMTPQHIASVAPTISDVAEDGTLWIVI
jgi:hypothetical protein